MAERQALIIGTRKGVFVAESDAERMDWSLRGPYCESWPSNHAIYDAASRTIFACATSAWYGPAIWRSSDFGETWSHSSEGLTYGDDGPTLEQGWSLAAVGGAVYAGVQPAGLFASGDGGETWRQVEGLRAHPHAAEWQPGGAGLILHTIVPEPAGPASMAVAISAAGVYWTEDGGATWDARNKGIRADFMPDPYPEFGQCAHHVELAPDGRTLYQQNHCGVYRSQDEGRSWQEISGGLPSDFGFPIAVHPHDPRTIYTIPLDAEGGRVMPGAHGAVWRSRNCGDTWEELTAGLPSFAYLGVLRQAMATDQRDPAGIYFGTSTGQLFASRDEGDSWREIASYLPPITSVEAAVFEDA